MGLPYRVLRTAMEDRAKGEKERERESTIGISHREVQATAPRDTPATAPRPGASPLSSGLWVGRTRARVPSARWQRHLVAQGGGGPAWADAGSSGAQAPSPHGAGGEAKTRGKPLGDGLGFNETCFRTTVQNPQAEKLPATPRAGASACDHAVLFRTWMKARRPLSLWALQTLALDQALTIFDKGPIHRGRWAPLVSRPGPNLSGQPLPSGFCAPCPGQQPSPNALACPPCGSAWATFQTERPRAGFGRRPPH